MRNAQKRLNNNLLPLDRRDIILILPVNTSADTFKIFSNLLRQVIRCGAFLIETRQQVAKGTAVHADLARITLDGTVMAKPLRIIVGVNNRIMAKFMKGPSAAVAAYKTAISTTGRAKVVIVFLKESVSSMI